ncbi:hypothetical protein PG994_008076 [Apiospora phragmitis]|uniref:Cyanovirin-N domain-containing protein n=1 Tax=Apiospora phragmitis TaxID=2905665 RepID=A0ABR1US14_9PEZI
MSLTAATGFLDQGCDASQDPWYLDDGVAKTYCATHVCDSNVQTSLNLNLCVGSKNGILYAQLGGNFGQSCKNCSILGSYDTLQCVCLDDAKDLWLWTTLSLNTGFIYNWFGYLSCYDQHQTDIPVSYYCKDVGWQPNPNDQDNCTNPSCQGNQADAGHVSTGADAGGAAFASNQPTAAPVPN